MKENCAVHLYHRLFVSEIRKHGNPVNSANESGSNMRVVLTNNG